MSRALNLRPIGWITTLYLVSLVVSANASPRQINGRIVGVHDGDTITLMDADNRQHKIRLSGIDAPELGQPFGRVSRQHLVELVVSREAVAECSKTDRYGRGVCRVLIRGEDISLAQINQGLAWHYKQYQREQSAADQQSYAGAEEQARRARTGLWRDPEPIAPWDWRQSQRHRVSPNVAPFDN